MLYLGHKQQVELVISCADAWTLAAGGIMKCDVIASGIVNAAKGVGIEVPLIVRLEGTNVERGKEILKSSGLDIIAASDLDDAAHRAVAALSKKPEP
jgi:succinyl-CoA synthetase beta subunit